MAVRLVNRLKQPQNIILDQDASGAYGDITLSARGLPGYKSPPLPDAVVDCPQVKKLASPKRRWISVEKA